MEINLTNHKEPARALRNAVLGVDGIAQNPKGTRIVYHRGTTDVRYPPNEVKRMAMDLYEIGLVYLVQRVYEPGSEYDYIAVMK